MLDHDTNQLGNRTRFLVSVALIMAVVLELFLVHMVIRLHLDIQAQRSELATKSDLRNLAVTLGPTEPAMAVLSSACTDCHTRERFASAHASVGEITELVDRMSEMEGAHIPLAETPRIEAALSLLKCAHCHTGDRLKEMAIMSPRERWDLVMRMSKEAGSTITPEDARRIRDFYGDFWGWHRP